MPILGSNTSGAPSVFYPETYGAVGDGTTNDQAAIQACIDAVSAAGGGTVQFSAKTYLVNASRELSDENLDLLRQGIELADGPTRPAVVERRGGSDAGSVIEITITEGRNRQVRRMIEVLDANVLELVRVAIGPIRIGELDVGRTRPLSAEEVGMLG